MNDGDASAKVEVVCALRHRQESSLVDLLAGDTVEDVVQRSGILDRFPEIEPAAVTFAIYGARAQRTTRVSAGDRVEVLRPLLVDPKESRRRRARKLDDG